MQKHRLSGAVVAALITCLAVPALAGAQAPPPPTATGGQTVKTLAQGVPTPTEFAFFKKNVFVGAFGDEQNNFAGGGVYRIRKGKAKRIKGSPKTVSGIAWRSGKLFVASGPKIVRMSRWNGKRFLRKKTIYRGPAGFTGFSGLAFGPDKRLYSGVQLNEQTDQKPDTGPFARSVVSMTSKGKDIRTVATGLRQPWQLTFVQGNPNPFVSVLADERSDPPPPDWVVNAKPGENYGYPTCTQAAKKDCKGFAKPIALLKNHASPMGISPIGQTLYVALFGGLGQGPAVVTMNTSGKQVKPFLTGYAAPVLAVGTRKGNVYTGDLTGAIYRVKAAG
jgi:glucose/arabinose dehydrogenase